MLRGLKPRSLPRREQHGGEAPLAASPSSGRLGTVLPGLVGRAGAPGHPRKALCAAGRKQNPSQVQRPQNETVLPHNRGKPAGLNADTEGSLCDDVCADPVTALGPCHCPRNALPPLPCVCEAGQRSSHRGQTWAEARRPHSHDAAQRRAAMHKYGLSAQLLVLAELSFTHDCAVVTFACPADKAHSYTHMKSPYPGRGWSLDPPGQVCTDRTDHPSSGPSRSVARGIAQTPPTKCTGITGTADSSRR